MMVERTHKKYSFSQILFEGKLEESPKGIQKINKTG